MKRTILTLSAALALSVAAWAQEGGKAPASLEGYVPADAILFARYQGFTAAAKTFQQTEILKLLNEPEVIEFGKDLSTFMDALMREKARNAPFTWDDIRLLTDSEIAFALLDVRGQVPSMVFVVRAGSRSDDLAKFVDRFVDKAAQGNQIPEDEIEGIRYRALGPFCIGWSGKDLIFTTGRETLRRIVGVINGQENDITKNDRYAAASRRFAGGREFLMAHFDVERLGAIIKELDGGRAGKTNREWQATGLDGVNYIRLAVAPDAPGVKVSVYVHAPQGAKGLFKLIPDQPVDEKAMLAAVDEAADDFLIARVSAGGIYDILSEFIGVVNNPDRLKDAQEAINGNLGFDLRKELLASLGEEMMLRTLGGGLQVCGTVRVKDDKTAADCIGKLVAFLSKETGRGGDEGLKAETLDYQGVTIHAVTITNAPVPITPSYAFARGKLFIALTPQTLKKALDVDGRPAAKPMIDSNAYRAVRGHVAAKPSVLSYSETRRNFDTVYAGVVTPMVQMLNGAKNDLPANNLAAKFPSSGAITPHLFGTIMAVSRDGEGYLIESYGPVGSLTDSAAGLGVLAGFALPAMAKSRAGARRASCMSNIRQIGLGMIQYAGDHDDKFPKSFGVLMHDGYLTSFRVFKCPDSGGKYLAPAIQNFKDTAVEDLDKAIAPICDYVMVPNVNHDADADIIVLYDKDGAHNGEGRNCFFNDGHVQWLSEAQFQKTIKAQEARLAKDR